jgi:2-aminoadipate transaminase
MSNLNIKTPEEIRLAGWARMIKRSELQLMLAATARPGVISLALGLPAAELFPTEKYAQLATRVMSEDARALQYGPPFRPLKTQIVNLMARRGVECSEEQIFLTSGAQQGLNLLTRLLLDEGGPVMLEELSYSGFQQVIEPFQPEYLCVPTDRATGIDVDEVEFWLLRGALPRLIYTVTDGHNPLGVSVSPSKRTRLVELAQGYGVPIIEDDPYGFLSYERLSEPPLRAQNGEWVFYVGSFSKIMAPALRVGWLVVPQTLIPKLSVVKEASDIDTSTFSQRLVNAYLESGELDGHLKTLRHEYRIRRDTMLRALRENFPSGASWNEPQSGVFIWVELPEEVDTGKLLKLAIEEEDVAFIPGYAFDVKGSRKAANAMRLNFSSCAPALIEEGIARLARVLKRRWPGLSKLYATGDLREARMPVA